MADRAGNDLVANSFWELCDVAALLPCIPELDGSLIATVKYLLPGSFLLWPLPWFLIAWS